MPLTLAQAVEIGKNATHPAGRNYRAEADLQKQQADREAALRMYLQQQEPEIAGKKLATEGGAMADFIKNPTIQQELENGRGVHMPGGGAVTPDPYANRTGKAIQGEEGAYQHAMGDYQHSTTKIPDAIKGVQQLMSAVADPSNRTSVGAARAAALRMLGVNRYNPDEANTTVAPNTFARAGSFFQRLGASNDADVLDPGLQKDLANLGRSAMEEIQQQHEVAKQQAVARYSGSSYAIPSKIDMLSRTLGTPIDTQLGALKKQYTPNPVAGDTQTPPVDKPKGLLEYLTPKANAAQPQAGTQGGQSRLVRVKHVGSGQTGTLDLSNPKDAADLKAGIYQQLGQ